MKKIFAITLTVMLLSALLAPLTVHAADHENNMNETMASAVYICTQDTTSSSNKETDAAGYADIILKNGESAGTDKGLKSGTMSFKDGVLTIENVTGVSKVEAFNGSLIVNVVGTNEFVHVKAGRCVFVDDQFDPDAGKKSDLTITSSTGGKLKVDSMNYVVYNRTGNILIDGNVDLEIISKNSCVERNTNGNPTDGTITFAGDCKVKMTTPKVGIGNNANGGLIQFKDNAQVSVTITAAGSFGVGFPGLKPEGKPADIVIKDKAKLTIDSGESACFKAGTAVLDILVASELEATGAKVGSSGGTYNFNVEKLNIVQGDSSASAAIVTAVDPNQKYLKITAGDVSKYPKAAAQTTAAAPKATTAAAATTKAAATAAAKTATSAAKTADVSVIVAAAAVASLSAVVVIKRKH